MKFKIKGTIIEELPELEIEANSKEEAEKIYEEKYDNDEIEGELYLEFDEEDSDREDDDEDDEDDESDEVVEIIV